jgi:hypothetical protein
LDATILSASSSSSSLAFSLSTSNNDLSKSDTSMNSDKKEKIDAKICADKDNDIVILSSSSHTLLKKTSPPLQDSNLKELDAKIDERENVQKESSNEKTPIDTMSPSRSPYKSIYDKAIPASASKLAKISSSTTNTTTTKDDTNKATINEKINDELKNLPQEETTKATFTDFVQIEKPPRATRGANKQSKVETISPTKKETRLNKQLSHLAGSTKNSPSSSPSANSLSPLKLPVNLNKLSETVSASIEKSKPAQPSQQKKPNTEAIKAPSLPAPSRTSNRKIKETDKQKYLMVLKALRAELEKSDNDDEDEAVSVCKKTKKK